MAIYPCSVGSHHYSGPQQSAYLGAVNGSRSERVKRRLCPVHLDQLVDWADEALQEIDVNAPPVPSSDSASRRCFRCKGEATNWALFVNVYPLKQEPRVWYGNACADDINDFLAEMDLTP